MLFVAIAGFHPVGGGGGGGAKRKKEGKRERRERDSGRGACFFALQCTR